MSWQYGSPGTPLAMERPRCWGMESAYDVSSRECRGCSSQNSCRDQVVRAQNARRVAVPPPVQAPTAAYFSQFGQVPPAQAFHPAQVPLAPPPMIQPPQQAPIAQYQPPPQQIRQAQPPQQQAVQVYQAPGQFQYGWLHDPLYYSAVASPPPMRPQLPGESFPERMVKNIGLAMLESFFLQSFLAVRQLVLPPAPPSEQPIDITPNR